MHPVLRHALPLFPLLLLGCWDEPVEPGQRPPTTVPAGLMEIRITGIGTPQQRATVRVLPTSRIPGTGAASPSSRSPWRGPLYNPRTLGTLPDTSPTVDGTVQLDPVSTASFTWGTRAGGGYRYVSATYRVRNATSGGVAYGDNRTNLTFIAASTSSTLNGTAISTLKKFDNSDAASGLATQILPTGWGDLSSSATLTARAPDVLQVYTESEIALAPSPADGYLLPYGFVARNPGSTSNRTLAANPDTSQFDGLITFAFKVPLQASAADDPFTISAMFLPVDDDQTWVTQSPEEADASSDAATDARATALGATVRSFLGTQAGATAAALMCNVRIAGTAGSPTSFLPDANAVDTVIPSPYTGSASFLATNASIAATFSHTMDQPTWQSFAVNSFQGGRQFRSGGYTGAGTATLSTPAGAFWPGDVIEVALTPALVCTPQVYRYRVAVAVTAIDSFAPSAGSPDTVGWNPVSVALGDVNGDGNLDLLAALVNSDTVTVHLGNGAGRFTAADTFAVGDRPRAVALGDLNGDGKLDAVTANYGAGDVTVALNNGTGGFGDGTSFAVHGDYVQTVALGDLNGDGNLDLAAASSGSVTVLLGDGTGSFTASDTITVGSTPQLAVGDVSGDGRLDFVTANLGSNSLTVLRGDGTGSFADTTIDLGAAPGALALGDVNGDGKLDVVTIGSNNVMVLLGSGTGGFSAAPNSPFSVGSSPYHVSLGDLNGDGKLDLVTANWGSNNVTVLEGDGTGGFTTAAKGPFAVGSGPWWAALGDVNTDGRLDIVAANGTQPTVTILLNH